MKFLHVEGKFADCAGVSARAYRAPGTKEYRTFGSLPQILSARALELKTKLGGADVMLAEVKQPDGTKKVVGYRVAVKGAMAVPANDEEWEDEIKNSMPMAEKLRKAGKLAADEAVLTKANLGVAKNRWLWDEVTVDPRYAGTGIAEALLNLTLREAKAQNVQSFSCEVDPKNAASIRFHASAGFNVDEMHSSSSRMTVPGRDAKILIKWRSYKGPNPSKISEDELDSQQARIEMKINAMINRINMPLNQLLDAVSSKAEPHLTRALLRRFVETKDIKALEVLGVSIGGRLTENYKDKENQKAIRETDIELRKMLRTGGLDPELRTLVRSTLTAATSCRLDKHSGIDKPRGILERNFLDLEPIKGIRTEGQFFAYVDGLKAQYDAERRGTHKARIGASICAAYYAHRSGFAEHPSYQVIIEQIMNDGFRSRSSEMQRMAGYALGHYERTLDEGKPGCENLLAALRNPKVPAWAAQQLVLWTDESQRELIRSLISQGKSPFANNAAERAFTKL